MLESAVTAQSAFDLQSLAALKRQARQQGADSLPAVARQMEGLFLQMMLKSMRAALPQDGLFNSSQTAMFTAMYDQQIAQQLTAKGTGLSAMILQQLQAQTAGQTAAAAPTDVSPGEAARAVQTDLLNSVPRQTLLAVLRQATGSDALPTVALPQQENGPALNSLNFVERLTAAAQSATRGSGIPHHLVLAQAALESGWGKREILTADGKPSYNLFGIKAGASWRGKTTEITTTEYVDGVARKVKAKFRVYASYAEALQDYVSLITRNPRYHKVMEADTPEQAAYALQEAGYATDPHYARKLVSVMQRLTHRQTEAVNAYRYTDFTPQRRFL